MDEYKKLRDRMVDVHLARRGIRDRRVLDAMRTVPRERFVREGLEEFAYEDSPLPIEEEQTISQPYIVAAMAEAAEIGPDLPMQARASRMARHSAGAPSPAADTAPAPVITTRRAPLTTPASPQRPWRPGPAPPPR